MKAAVFRRYGPPGVVRIEEIARPAPAENEMLVRVRASTVCAADRRIRGADPFLVRMMVGVRRPKLSVLGMEFSGSVEAVGAAVTGFRVGDEVFGSTGFKFGAHAEYLVVAESGNVALRPSTIALEDCASICFGALSALHFLRQARIQTGDRVLVYGASGSVGTAAVQLAKHFGAHVTGVCSAANLDLVRSLGADRVVDYTQDDFSAGGATYDIVFDTIGKSGVRRSVRSLAPGGRYVACAGVLSPLAGKIWAIATRQATGGGRVARAEQGDVELFRQLLEQGRLRPVIDRRYRLDEIADAHRYADTGHKKGNLLVLIS